MCGDVAQTNALFEAPNAPETHMLNPVLTILVQQIQDTFDGRQTGPIGRLGYGNAKLDAMTGGLHEGSLTIVMGPPMSGKTTFVGRLALEIARNLANEVLFHSSELDARDTGLKWLSDISGVSVSALVSAELEDDDWSRLSHGLGVLHDKRIFLADMPKDWQYVAKHGRKFAEAHPDLRLIVVDNVHSFLPLSSRKRLGRVLI